MTCIRVCAVALLAYMATPATVNLRAHGSHSGLSLIAEHRYRIVGRARLALFWSGGNDVGSARMTWRSDGRASALTLLAGSDPERAPRRLNQWGYLREEVRADRAEVFTLRTLSRGEARSRAGSAAAEGSLFGVSCTSISDHDVRSAHTIVSAPGVTYRMFDRVLDRIAVSPQWEVRQTPRPAGADAGFLTALQHAIRVGGTESKSFTRPPLTYIFNNSVYDLRIRGTEPLGPTTLGTQAFDQLVRTDFSIRDRTVEEGTKFGVTYSPDRSDISLPLQIFFKPSFWLSVELRLDDEADAPTDPAADQSVLTRVRAICAGVGR